MTLVSAFNKLHYLGVVFFKHNIYLIAVVSAHELIIGWRIHSATSRGLNLFATRPHTYIYLAIGILLFQSCVLMTVPMDQPTDTA